MTDGDTPRAEPGSVPTTYEPLLENDRRTSDLTRRAREAAQSGPMAGLLDDSLEGMPGAGGGDGPLVLDQHFISTVAYTRDVSGKTSFFSALFKGDATHKQVGVIQEAKSFTVVKVDGRDVEMGVAVRMQVEASSFGSNVQVSIPNIAAESQLNLSRAEMEISVRGYAAPLGDLLPVPSAVNVTSYGEYLDAFNAIQKRIFSKEGQADFSPVALGLHKAEAGG
ncbi:hypothetical protein [Salipiger sp.]|uniref:hypothetical protein n=1 Tax=Salipiger sp. TaxID=2078585 RepID=UPI003A97B925